MATDSVQMQIDGLRRKLLDLSMRNRMLNFRPSKRLGIAVIGEDSDQVHRTLVDDGRKMVFIGKPDAPKRPRAAYDLPPLFDDPVAQEEFRQEAIEELESHLNHPYSTVDQTDTRLNTDEPHSLLETKLRTVAREASLAAEELGIDTLFLTLGMLEWREPGADRAYGAPLLFVPVSLERQKHGTLRLVHSGGDVGDNLPLRAKLRELGVELPSYNDEEGARLYFDSVRSALRKRGDWAVMPNEIALGFFNYEKYAMYVDLGGDAWPEDRKPWVHPDLTAILSRGFPPGASSIGEETFLDDVRPPATSYEVYDADSSQTLAMIRAADGLSMVVEGPPGTGKSQTITNIIAQAVQAGKTVLFVSAKRAALEVVRRKLNEADLGDICLDLHDKFSNRRQFYAELKRTAERAVSAPSAQERVTRLTELRDRLNTYVIAVNEPLDEYECTPFQAISRLAALPPETAEDRAGRVVFARLRQWTDAEVRKRLPLVQALQNQVRELGAPPDQHAFSGVGIEFLDPGVQLDLREDLASALQTLERALAAIAGAAAAFGIPRPPCRAQLVTLSRCLDRVVNAPAIDGLAVASEVWLAEEARFRSVIDAIRQRADCRSRRGTQLLPTAWEIDWTPELQAYEQRAQQWRRLFS
ncbi:MAG TPA: DUF4011 domain-containing protein, partial [Candidatus Krumholzibacteria bacterium]